MFWAPPCSHITKHWYGVQSLPSPYHFEFGIQNCLENWTCIASKYTSIKRILDAFHSLHLRSKINNRGGGVRMTLLPSNVVSHISETIRTENLFHFQKNDYSRKNRWEFVCCLVTEIKIKLFVTAFQVNCITYFIALQFITKSIISQLHF